MSEGKSKVDLDAISYEEWREMLERVMNLDCACPSDLLKVPGVYEEVIEYYNNAIIEEFERGGAG